MIMPLNENNGCLKEKPADNQMANSKFDEFL